MLLVLGFFTCGFQLAFITVHLPSYLIDRGLSAEVGGWTLATIGLFNIIGSLTSGYLGNRMPKRYILSIIYFARALSIVAFISLPASPVATLIFGAVTGLLWLSTVPPTSALVAVMFGTRWLAMLFGFAFFSHQVGGFLGVWLGGFVFDTLRLLQSGLVALGVLRRDVGAHQPADRRKAGRASRAGAGLRRLHDRRGVAPQNASDQQARRAWRHSRQSSIEKAESGTKAALDRFRRSQSDGRRRHRPRRIFHGQLQGRPRRHRQGAGGAPLPDDRRHRLRRHGRNARRHPDWKPGDKVILNGWGCGETHLGAYAEKARVKGDWLVPLPAGMTAREAMAIGTAGYTAMLR